MTVELNTRSASVKTAYEANANTNAFTDVEKTKLTDIEALADVTDATNVAAAGALMDSEVTNLAQVKAFSSADYATAAQGGTADTALQDVVEDTTPQLGGNLDVLTRTLTTSTVDGGITLTPNGTGNVTLGTLVLNADATIGAGQDNYVLTYDHAAETWGPEAGGAGAGDFLADGSVDMTGEFRTDVGTFDSDVADGAAAVAFSYDTAVAYSTDGAKLANWKTNNVEKAYINKDGHLNIGTAFQHAALAVRHASNGVALSLETGTETVTDVESIRFGRSNAQIRWHSLYVANDNSPVSNNFLRFEVHTGSGETRIDCLDLNGGTGRVANRTGNFATRGDAESFWTTLKISTTNATPTTMLMNGAVISIPASTAWTFSALVTARSNSADGNNCAAYKLEGLLKRDAANNTAIVGSVTKTVIAEDTDAVPWDVTAEANDTNESLSIIVTGEADTSIRWVAKVDIAQVTFA